MFKLAQSESYSWPVKVTMALDEGRFTTETFDAKFKRISQSRIKELLEAENASDFAFCKEVLIGWKGVTDGDGNEVPYSESSRDKLLDVPAVAKSVVESFLLSATGQGAKRKNL